jgi:hypothetical protein
VDFPVSTPPRKRTRAPWASDFSFRRVSTMHE